MLIRESSNNYVEQLIMKLNTFLATRRSLLKTLKNTYKKPWSNHTITSLFEKHSKLFLSMHTLTWDFSTKFFFQNTSYLNIFSHVYLAPCNIHGYRSKLDGKSTPADKKLFHASMPSKTSTYEEFPSTPRNALRCPNTTAR